MTSQSNADVVNIGTHLCRLAIVQWYYRELSSNDGNVYLYAAFLNEFILNEYPPHLKRCRLNK